jgi:hypothetical protein
MSLALHDSLAGLIGALPRSRHDQDTSAGVQTVGRRPGHSHFDLLTLFSSRENGTPVQLFATSLLAGAKFTI